MSDNSLPFQVINDFGSSPDVLTPGDPPYYPDFPTQDFPTTPDSPSNSLPNSVTQRLLDIGGKLADTFGGAAVNKLINPQNKTAGQVAGSANASTQATALGNFLPKNFATRAFTTATQPMVLILVLAVVVFGFAILGRK